MQIAGMRMAELSGALPDHSTRNLFMCEPMDARTVKEWSLSPSQAVSNT